MTEASAAIAPAARDGSPAARPGWATSHAFWLIALAPVLTHAIGTVFNIWYNRTHVRPLLSDDQFRHFVGGIAAYNGFIYPVTAAVWFGILASVWRPARALLCGGVPAADRLATAQRRAINLPWTITAIGGVGWLFCGPALLLAVHLSADPLDPQVNVHLPISVLIGGLIAVTQTFFLIELLSQRLLYPVLFQQKRPADTVGACPVSLRCRGVLWMVSAAVCPIVCLLLLLAAPRPESVALWFAVSVSAVGIAFGVTAAWLLGKLVAEPVDLLRRASQRVSGGDLTAEIDLLRADEFGLLIDEFNAMVRELREKQRLQETFGRHVGQRTACQILARDPGLGGAEQELTVLFADLRDFTARCADCPAEKAVGVLNRFFTQMVHVIEEEHGGIVNKFLGDGLMALFGVAGEEADHADRAVAAARQMLARMETLNAELVGQGLAPLGVGIGIHTGRAVVGSIGSPRRMEYTAIGDTVNVASRVEQLTKNLGRLLLVTAETHRRLRSDGRFERLDPQTVKGRREPLEVFAPR